MVKFENGQDFIRLCEMLENKGFEVGVYWATECKLYKELTVLSPKDEQELSA